MELIDRQALVKQMKETYCTDCENYNGIKCRACWIDDAIGTVDDAPAVDAAPAVHGRWILEAHKERTNDRWNVTAECSECHADKKEIYAGFFPGVPDAVAEVVILDSAKAVKLSNYCPNCGADMRGAE